MRDTTPSELTLLHNPIRAEGYKVEIIRKSNDAVVDITDLVMSGSITLSSDNRVSTCSIKIEDVYPVCNTNGVSPYLTGSSYNTPDQLLWPGNEIKVYVAVNTLGSTADTFKMLFHGILGDAIVPGSSSSGKKTVSLTIRDQAKMLQDAFIKGEFVYGEAAGTPVVAVIQGILDDNVTETLHVKPTLDGNYDIDGCPFVVTPIKVGNCSVWDAINKVIGTTASDDIGYELRYKFLPKDDTSTTDNEGNTITISADGFYLTLLEIDQTQTVSDDNIVAGTDSISQYKINVYDDTIRNDIYGVFYARTTKERTEINVQDATSIAAYGKRTMVIGQKDYPWIDTTAEMEALMSVALNALKDVPATDAFSTQLMYHVEPNDLLGTTLARLTTGSAQVGITKITHNFATGGGAGRKKKSSTTFVGRRDAVVGGTIKTGGGDDPGTTVAPTVSPTGYSSSFIQDVDGSYTRTTLNVTAFSDVLVEYYDWKYSIESSGEWVPATTSEPSYIVSNQPPSTNITWACRVKLVSEDGSDSNFTAWCADQTAVTASDGIAPAAPTLVANVGNQQCVLTLTKPATDSDGSANTDFDYFKVYYDTNATVTTADSFITTKSTQYPFPASVRTYFKAAAVDIWGNEGVLSSIDDAIPTSTSADAVQALADAAQAQSTADGKIVGFYQDAQPGSGMAYGDIWIDTDGHTPNTTADIYRYQDATGGYTSGAMTWVNEPTSAIGLVYLNAVTAQATADGKVTTFYQDGVPTSEGIGDLWVDTNDSNKIYRAASAGATTIAAGQWVLVRQEDSPGDYTQTVIDAGVVTTGTLQVKDGAAVTKAGITGSTSETASTSVRIWAGDTYANRATAPFRVTQAGIMYATGAVIDGTFRTGAVTGARVEITPVYGGSTHALTLYDSSNKYRFGTFAGLLEICDPNGVVGVTVGTSNSYQVNVTLGYFNNHASGLGRLYFNGGAGNDLITFLSGGSINGVSGTLLNLRYCDLEMATCTVTGTFATGSIPGLPTSKITSGTFGDSYIPNLAASKITSGEFAMARLPSTYLKAGAIKIDSSGSTVELEAAGTVTLDGVGIILDANSGNMSFTIGGTLVTCTAIATTGDQTGLNDEEGLITLSTTAGTRYIQLYKA